MKALNKDIPQKILKIKEEEVKNKIEKHTNG
jgi:hypothetical protein